MGKGDLDRKAVSFVLGKTFEHEHQEKVKRRQIMRKLRRYEANDGIHIWRGARLHPPDEVFRPRTPSAVRRVAERARLAKALSGLDTPSEHEKGGSTVTRYRGFLPKV